MSAKTIETNIRKLREPLSIFTKYKTMVTPKINILNLFKMFIFEILEKKSV